MRRILSVAVSTALSITGVFASPAIASTPSPHAWQVQAGSLAGFDLGGPIGGGNQFYPDRLTIHQGDSIDFTPVGPHTVTFNRPPVPVFALLSPPFVTSSPATISSKTDSVSSPIGFSSEPYNLTFAKSLPPGTYKVICALHLGMTETVDVVPLAEVLPKNDAQYLAIAQAQITRDLTALAEIRADATENYQDQDGNVTVLVGAGDRHGSNIRFFPAQLTIHVGQSVTFLKTKDPTEPHTVNFASPDDPFTELLPWGGSTYPAPGFTASGFMVTQAQFDFYHLADTGLPAGLLRYRLKFTQVGSFDYFCAIHDGPGMKGTVHVVK